MWNNELGKEHYDRTRRGARERWSCKSYSLAHLCDVRLLRVWASGWACVWDTSAIHTNVRTTLWEGLTTRGDLLLYSLYFASIHIIYRFFLCCLPLVVFFGKAATTAAAAAAAIRAHCFCTNNRREAAGEGDRAKKKNMRKNNENKNERIPNEKKRNYLCDYSFVLFEKLLFFVLCLLVPSPSSPSLSSLCFHFAPHFRFFFFCLSALRCLRTKYTYSAWK